MIGIKGCGVLITLVLSLMLAALQVVRGDISISPAQLGPQAAGADVTLECTCSDCDSLLWQHNGMSLTERLGVIIADIDEGGVMTSMLTLEGIRDISGGAYKCHDPTNPFDEPIVFLNVEEGEVAIEIYEPTTATMSVSEGDSIDLKCQGQEGVRLEWTHNGKLLKDRVDRVTITDAHDVIETGLQKSLMTRRNSVPIDGGLYVCRDTDDPSSKAEVTVNIGQPSSQTHPVEIIDPSGASTTVSPGRSFSLQCVADRNTELAWYHGDEELENERDGYLLQTAEDIDAGLATSMLTKEDAAGQDSGQYFCRNAHNAHDHDFVTVTVSADGGHLDRGGTPTKDPSVTRMRVGAGRLGLDCMISHGDPTNVKWLKYGAVIEAGSKYGIITNSESSRLEIKNAEKDDAGFYECKFTSRSTGIPIAVLRFEVITVKCPELTAPVNGSFSQCPQEPVYGESCSFHCDHGLKLTDNRALMCQLDSKTNQAVWNRKVPMCKGQSFIDKLFGDNSGSHVQAAMLVTCSMAFVTLAAILF